MYYLEKQRQQLRKNTPNQITAPEPNLNLLSLTRALTLQITKKNSDFMLEIREEIILNKSIGGGAMTLGLGTQRSTRYTRKGVRTECTDGTTIPPHDS